MRIKFIDKRFNASSRGIIEKANTILGEYAGKLTLRQLYYQFVARGLSENTAQVYKRIGGVVSDARKAGLIDWDTVEDRTRYVRKPPVWSSPGAIVQACAEQYQIDMWRNQDRYVEVWIE